MAACAAAQDPIGPFGIERSRLTIVDTGYMVRSCMPHPQEESNHQMASPFVKQGHHLQISKKRTPNHI